MSKRQSVWLDLCRRITAKAFCSIIFLAIVSLLAACKTSLNFELFRAASNGDAVRVGMLLDKGANVNAREEEGETPLMYAAVEGHSNVVTLLLQRGAEINAVSQNNETALARAAFSGKIAAVTALLDGGASVDKTTSNGTTPLMYATARGYLDVASVLLMRGAKVNAKDNEGDTALAYAVVRGASTEMIRLLLERGVDATLLNNHGESPLTLARKKSHPDVVELLEKASR